MKKTTAFLIITACILALSGCSSNDARAWKNYFDNIDFIQDNYAGILANNNSFTGGKEYAPVYDYDCPEYETLITKYEINKIAGDGTAFDRALRLMDEFAPRLKHKSNYDNHVEMNSIALLDYSLDQPKHGINCLNKSKILEEMCLALQIKARRVSIMPYSPYDTDNHVVIEIYDESYSKWMMLDITNDLYFINKDGLPLSLMEIRTAAASNEFVTAAYPGYTETPEELDEKFKYTNTYITKDLFYFIYDSYNGFGYTDENISLYLIPDGFDLRGQLVNHFEFLTETAASQGWGDSFVQQFKDNGEYFKTCDFNFVNMKSVY